MRTISEILPRPCLLALSVLLVLSTAHAHPDAKIELIEPFDFTFSSEPPVMFVRITNTGTEPLAIGLGDESDLQFENDPALASDSSELAPWTRRFSYVRNQPKSGGGRPVKPGESLVLSQLDYCDMDFSMYHFEYQRIRPHLRVRTGTWIAGDWQERKIEDAPNLTAAKPLYDFKLGTEGQQHSVIALPVAGETWRVSCRLPSSYKNLPAATGDLDFRICRLPGGKMPISIAHDVDASHRLQAGIPPGWKMLRFSAALVPRHPALSPDSPDGSPGCPHESPGRRWIRAFQCPTPPGACCIRPCGTPPPVHPGPRAPSKRGGRSGGVLPNEGETPTSLDSPTKASAQSLEFGFVLPLFTAPPTR